MNCFHLFRTDNVLKKHERICENNKHCEVIIPTESNKILKYNYGEKSLRLPFVIYADLECLLLKQQSCQNNPNKSYTERKAIHEPCRYSINLVSSFDYEQDEQRFYRGKDCIKRFCCKLKELCLKVVNCEQKEIISLTVNENIYYEYQKKRHICNKTFWYDKNEKSKFKLYKKVSEHCHFMEKFRGAAHNICNFPTRFSTSRKKTSERSKKEEIGWNRPDTSLLTQRLCKGACTSDCLFEQYYSKNIKNTQRI